MLLWNPKTASLQQIEIETTSMPTQTLIGGAAQIWTGIYSLPDPFEQVLKEFLL